MDALARACIHALARMMARISSWSSTALSLKKKKRKEEEEEAGPVVLLLPLASV